MKDKAIKYLIILLLVPLVLSILIAIYTGSNTKSDSNYDSMDVSSNAEILEREEKIKSNNAYIYLSVFLFVVIGASVWIYLKKKDAV